MALLPSYDFLLPRITLTPLFRHVDDGRRAPRAGAGWAGGPSAGSDPPILGLLWREALPRRGELGNRTGQSFRLSRFPRGVRGFAAVWTPQLSFKMSAFQEFPRRLGRNHLVYRQVGCDELGSSTTAEAVGFGCRQCSSCPQKWAGNRSAQPDERGPSALGRNPSFLG